MRITVGYHIMNEVEVPETEVKHALAIARLITNETEWLRVLGTLLNDIILNADPNLINFFRDWDGEITSVFNNDFESNNLNEILWES